MRQMAEVKYALEDQVRQAFLDPLHLLQTKDIKDLLVSNDNICNIYGTLANECSPIALPSGAPSASIRVQTCATLNSDLNG